MFVENEEEWIARSRAGDPAAYGKLVAAHEKSLFNIAYRMVGDYHDAQDLTQTALVKAHRSLDRHDCRYPFFAWVYRILVHEALDLLARRKRERTRDRGLAREVARSEAAPGPERSVQEHETDALVQEALQHLSPEYREVVVLRHFLDLSYREIGETIGVMEKTVKSRLFTARQQLRALLVRRGVTR